MLEVLEGIEYEEEIQSLDIPWEYAVDFDTMTVTDEIVYGAEAIKIWCYFALMIERFKYRVFTWDYGSELEELIGDGYSNDLTKAEVIRLVEEALTCNPYISEVDVYEVDFADSRLSIGARVYTDYGTSDIEIEV